MLPSRILGCSRCVFCRAGSQRPILPGPPGGFYRWDCLSCKVPPPNGCTAPSFSLAQFEGTESTFQSLHHLLQCLRGLQTHSFPFFLLGRAHRNWSRITCSSISVALSFSGWSHQWAMHRSSSIWVPGSPLDWSVHW